MVQPKTKFKGDNAPMMIEAAKQGIGMVIMPSILVNNIAKDSNLITILQEYKTVPERNLYAMFPPNRYLSTRLRLFVDHIADYCKINFV